MKKKKKSVDIFLSLIYCAQTNPVSVPLPSNDNHTTSQIGMILYFLFAPSLMYRTDVNHLPDIFTPRTLLPCLLGALQSHHHKSCLIERRTGANIQNWDHFKNHISSIHRNPGSNPFSPQIVSHSWWSKGAKIMLYANIPSPVSRNSHQRQHQRITLVCRMGVAADWGTLICC